MPSTLFSRLIDRLHAFRADEDGAVTVDFVVLTSFIVLMGGAHAKDVADGTVSIADDVSGCVGTDIADIVVGGDPDTFVANMEAAAAACSAR